MSAENLRAVGLVVKIVRELDRYHGFAAADRRAGGDRRTGEAEAREPRAPAGDSGEQAFVTCRARSLSAPGPGQRPGPTRAPALDVEAPVTPPGDRPRMAPQQLKFDWAASKRAPSENCPDLATLAPQSPSAPREPENPRPMAPNDDGAHPSAEPFAAAAPLPLVAAPDLATGDGSESRKWSRKPLTSLKTRPEMASFGGAL